MPKLTRITLITALLTSAACSANRQVLPGGEIIVDRSHAERPDWVNQRKIDNGSVIVFVGQERSRERGLAETGAKLNALVNLGDAYLVELDNTMGHVKKEIPDELDRYLKDVAEAAAKDVPISGAVTREIYWEKIEKNTYGEVQYVYDTWAVVEIDLEDYQRGLRTAMNRIKSERRVGPEAVDKIKAYEDRLNAR